MKPTEMLAEVLRRATLTAREKESFEDMYDRIQRFGRCSAKQKAWIEKVFFGQKLDQQVPFARRRVVVPTWLKNEPQAPSRMAALEPSLIKAVGTTAREVPGEYSSPRQILVKARPASKSGTFMATRPSVALKSHQVAYLNYPGVQRETPVTSLLQFEELCPRIHPGSRQHQKVAEFFAGGGVVLKIKPLAEVTQVA